MMQDEKDKMLALFEDESKWCQRVEARDERGNPVHFDDARATAWDVVGGMCFLFGWERACKLFVQVGQQFTGMKRGHAVRNREMAAMAALQDFNDGRETTFELIMAKLREMRVYCPRVPALAGS